MLILTNFERFPDHWTAKNGQSGRGEMAKTAGEFMKRARHADLLMINCDIVLTMRVCAMFLARPWLRKPIIAVDVVLRKPKTFRGRMSVRLKKLLLRRVDLFIHYFQDTTGYERYYGIGGDRSLFVPFKANLRYRMEVGTRSDGRYILCLGRSMRDYDTFFAAVGRLPCPVAIPSPDFAQLDIHESRFTTPVNELPANVEVLADDGSEESMLQMMQEARLIVLPILRTSICASGVSTYLNAMLMRKCVIMTAGPGASDILTDQALICEPEDPAALAALVRRAWEDDELRERTAEAGYQYVLSLGGEPELRQRIIDSTCEYFARQNPLS
jgi:glycosyltransferase involved in cell wall biosynthesis